MINDLQRQSVEEGRKMEDGGKSGGREEMKETEETGGLWCQIKAE